MKITFWGMVAYVIWLIVFTVMVGFIISSVISLFSVRLTQGTQTALDLEEYALWMLINDYRQAHGVQAVGLNDELVAAAEWMSDDMVANDRYSHTDSLGRNARQRVTDLGYSGYSTWIGENLAAGWDNARAAFEAWKGSPGHNDIMLGKYYWAVGIARAYDEDSTYGWYWTIDFGGRGPAWFPPTSIAAPTLPSEITPISTPTAAPMPVVLPTMGSAP